MNYYLGFDAGTQSVKVAVYDEDMNCIVSSSAPTTLTYPEPGWVSMDVDEYLALTIKGMKECASQMKEKGLYVTKIKSIICLLYTSYNYPLRRYCFGKGVPTEN